MENSTEMNEITMQKALSIWWSMVWRTILASMIIGAILGFIGGVIVGIVGRPDLGGIAGGLFGMLGSIPAGVWALKVALSKKHAGYSVILVKA